MARPDARQRALSIEKSEKASANKDSQARVARLEQRLASRPLPNPPSPPPPPERKP